MTGEFELSESECQAHEAFMDYVEAKAFADATGDFHAAAAAGQAWVRFLNTFLPADRHMPVIPVFSTNVIPFSKERVHQ